MQPNERLKGTTNCGGKAGLAEGTNPNTIKTANQIDYAIDGVAYRKAATDNIAMTALAQQAANTTCLYTVWLDTGGNVTLTKGGEVLSADLSAGNVVLKHGNDVSGQCAIGQIKVVTGATTFTSGSTDLSAANVTATYEDWMGGRVRPRLT